jgi:hypothetical protein
MTRTAPSQIFLLDRLTTPIGTTLIVTDGGGLHRKQWLLRHERVEV